jgi:class 3 adenylate cyclase
VIHGEIAYHCFYQETIERFGERYNWSLVADLIYAYLVGMARVKQIDGDIAVAFAREQQSGLTAALLGRLAVLAAIAIWIGFTRQPPVVYYMMGLVAVFAGIGLAQILVVHKNGVRAWQLYLFMFLEVAILATAIAAFSGPATKDLPVPMGFRFGNFIFFFLFIASAAFSYAPGLVLWSGGAAAIAWILASIWVLVSHETVGWVDIPPGAPQAEFLRVFMDPMFFGFGSRLQEAIILIAVSGLLALVVWRARRVVIRQAQAERDRAAMAGVFGQYVPQAVADKLISEEGALAPQEQVATVMMTDIENFTGISEQLTPAELLSMLDEYFDSLAEIIARHGGVVDQFIGDAVMATFNVPVRQEDHANAAIRAGLEIETTMQDRIFMGQLLRTRVGINTGPVIAGSVGSEGRRSYTVYGDVVNAAARIEAANKNYGSTMLIAEATADAAGDEFDFHAVASLTFFNDTATTEIYTIAKPPE